MMKKEVRDKLILITLFLSLLSCNSQSIKVKADLEIINPTNYASGARTIMFSGYNWTVRTTSGLTQGPGPNYFNDSASSVWLDANGYLHLKIIQVGGTWYCAEVYSALSFGYGTYTFRLAPGFENLDVNMVVGLFTYFNDTQEIDIEFARWGQAGASNGQFAIQPASALGNLNSFYMQETTKKSIHSFTWCKDYIRFRSAWGTDMTFNTAEPINEWYYTGVNNPIPRTEHVHINLWLMSGLAPINGLEAEIVIEEFKFTASNCDDPIPIPSLILWSILISSLVGLIIIGVLVRKRRKSKKTEQVKR